MVVTFLLIALVALVIYAGSQRLSGLAMGIVFLVASVGIALVVSPELASSLARSIGVGRGADLILYLAVIAGFFGTTYFFVRMRRLEGQMIVLAQTIALLDTVRPREDRVQP